MKSPRTVEKEYTVLLDECRNAAEQDDRLNISAMMSLVQCYQKHQFSLSRKHNVYHDILSFVGTKSAQEVLDQLGHFNEAVRTHLQVPLTQLAQGVKDVQPSEPILSARELLKQISRCQTGDQLIEVVQRCPNKLIADNITTFVNAVHEANGQVILDRVSELPEAIRTSMSAAAQEQLELHDAQDKENKAAQKQTKDATLGRLSIHIKAAEQLYQRSATEYKSAIRHFAHQHNIPLDQHLETAVRAQLQAREASDPVRQHITGMHKAVMACHQSHEALKQIKSDPLANARDVESLCQEIKTNSSTVHGTKLTYDREAQPAPSRPGRSNSD